jgi:hypothetical protein
MNTRQSLEQDALRRRGCKRAREREHIISRRRRRSSSALTYSLGFMAKNAAGRSLESILQAVKHDYCFEPFTAEDKPQNKNEIKAQLLRFAVKFYHQIHTERKEGLNSCRVSADSPVSFFSSLSCIFANSSSAFPSLSIFILWAGANKERERMLCRWISLADIRFPKLSGGVQPRRIEGKLLDSWEKNLSLPRSEIFSFMPVRLAVCAVL